MSLDGHDITGASNRKEISGREMPLSNNLLKSTSSGVRGSRRPFGHKKHITPTVADRSDETSQVAERLPAKTFTHGSGHATTRGRGRGGRSFARGGRGNRNFMPFREPDAHSGRVISNNGVEPTPLLNADFSLPPPPPGINAEAQSGTSAHGYVFNPRATPFVPRTRGSNPRVRREERRLADSNLSLRERLIHQLEDNVYECMICCQVITDRQAIWSCGLCFAMFHISGGCITAWANKSRETDQRQTGTWRCPGCQKEHQKVPYEYRCFCGKERNPRVQNFPDTPHSCGRPCGKKRGFGCPHPCSELCHPGPCPECPSMTTRKCECGSQTQVVRCGFGGSIKCAKVCGRSLNCGEHTCERVCHAGDCDSCSQTVDQVCFCGSLSRTVDCTRESLEAVSDPKAGAFSCGRDCNGLYECGIHHCKQKCHRHARDCGSCPLSPSRITHCPCGRETVVKLLDGKSRTNCEDAIPTCGRQCGKLLNCGGTGERHRCASACHEGPCPPCALTTTFVCRCGNLKKALPCIDAVNFTGAHDFIGRTVADEHPMLCERRCKKIKSCGIHRCQDVCCTLTEHICLQICNRKLSCGLHFCDRLCHANSRCPPCLQASFDEQFCLCGATVREPPVPCGTPLPECSQPCARAHLCEHPVRHNCHTEASCPPCVFLTEKPCYCGKEIRKNVPCHLNDVSCGQICGRSLPCAVHSCPRKCHKGECIPENKKCTLPCSRTRIESCGHACSLPCHGETPCPPSECRQKMPVTCFCGRRRGQMACADVEREFEKDKIRRAMEAAEETKEGHEEAIKILKREPDKLERILCDRECARLMRNRQFAEALELNTDEQGELVDIAPCISYSDFLRNQLRDATDAVKKIEETLLNLSEAAEGSYAPVGQVLRHSFPPMKVELRRVIHEYAAFFNMTSEAVDPEPKRSVIVAVKRGVSRPPLVLLTSLLNCPKGLLPHQPPPQDIASDAPTDGAPEEKKEESSLAQLKPSGAKKRAAPPRLPQPAPPLAIANAFEALAVEEGDVPDRWDDEP